MKRLKMIIILMLVLFVTVAMISCYGTVTYREGPPPPGPPPGPHWVKGHWSWDGADWVWIQGHWRP